MSRWQKILDTTTRKSIIDQFGRECVREEGRAADPLLLSALKAVQAGKTLLPEPAAYAHAGRVCSQALVALVQLALGNGYENHGS